MKERINLEKLPFPQQMMSAMTNILGNYCKANNLEHMSADDILTTHENLTDDQKLWLNRFVEAWDKAQVMES